MVVERWQLCRNRENDNRWRAATKTISQPHAALGRRAAYSRPGIGGCGVYMELEPPGDAALIRALLIGFPNCGEGRGLHPAHHAARVSASKCRWRKASSRKR